MEINFCKKTNGLRESLNKARKRHFDSRWRASIASCFETLLHVVPMNRRAIKKQSKANILEATARHLDLLEKTTVMLLQEKARKIKVQDVKGWCAQEIELLKSSFINVENSRPRKRTKRRTKYTGVENKITKTEDLTDARIRQEHAKLIKETILPKIESNISRDPTDAPMELYEDQIGDALCCKEELCASDDEGVTILNSHEVTPRILNSPDIRVSKRSHKPSDPIEPWKSRRSLINELNAQVAPTVEKNPTKTANSQNFRGLDNYITSQDRKLDPWLTNRTIFCHEDARSTSSSHSQETFQDEDLTFQRFIGQNSPLFGQELENLLNYQHNSNLL